MRPRRGSSSRTRTIRRPAGGQRCRSPCRSSPAWSPRTRLPRPARQPVPLSARLLGPRRSRVPGFARVEQFDAEHVPSQPAALPTLRTVSWFHLGPVGSRAAWHELDLRDEYWDGDPPRLGARATALTTREQARSLRGSSLRREVYALDGSGAKRARTSSRRRSTRSLRSCRRAAIAPVSISRVCAASARPSGSAATTRSPAPRL